LPSHAALFLVSQTRRERPSRPTRRFVYIGIGIGDGGGGARLGEIVSGANSSRCCEQMSIRRVGVMTRRVARAAVPAARKAGESGKVTLGMRETRIRALPRVGERRGQGRETLEERIWVGRRRRGRGVEGGRGRGRGEQTRGTGEGSGGGRAEESVVCGDVDVVVVMVVVTVVVVVRGMGGQEPGVGTGGVEKGIGGGI
jgi:hypothetical protein